MKQLNKAKIRTPLAVCICVNVCVCVRSSTGPSATVMEVGQNSGEKQEEGEKREAAIITRVGGRGKKVRQKVLYLEFSLSWCNVCMSAFVCS